MTTNLKSRVPHLRDSFIVAKVGIARKRDRFPFRTPKARHPERSGAKSKDPDNLHATKTDRTLSTENAVVFAVASEIGPGFRPWDMLFSPRHNFINEATA
jgi:hypothetical protein